MKPGPVACYSSAVIPTAWTPVHRPSDAEHVGYLVPDGADGHVVPTSLVGLPLGPAQPSADAVALLVAQGLRSLDRRWWCRLPHTLPRGVLLAAEPSPDWQWQSVVLVEVSAAGCTVRLEMAEPAQLRARAALPVPVGDLLRTDPGHDQLS
jgi:hypothetical protein